MAFTITMFYAGLLGLVFLALSFRVVRMRRGFKIGIGSGGNDALGRAARAHGNFAEYVPMTLLLIALVEAGTAAPVWLVHLLGIALLVGRCMHGFIGLNRHSGYSVGRFWGTAITWLAILVSALILVVTAIGRWLI